MNQQETYEYCAEIEFEYLKKLGLLDNIEFKYIEGYLPFEDIPVIDFEWELINNSNGYEFNVKYRFTLENEEKKLEKTFSGVIENINTSSYFAIYFMELREYYEDQQEEEEEECECFCNNCKSKHNENWIGCELCDTIYCNKCGKSHKEEEEEYKINTETVMKLCEAEVPVRHLKNIDTEEEEEEYKCPISQEAIEALRKYVD
tara:strand:- start:3385 stop:3993 length:609 start_codon:yes stop_codon:yes gene_type:complete